MSNRKKVIERYEGALTAAQVAAGMNAARRNATSLIDEATILLQAKRHARACALAILSIEESGKISLLRLIATAANQKHLKDAWRSYRDHKAKNVKWIVAELAAKGARKLDDLSPMFARIVTLR
jgi:AbiV family abortive infection protein